MKMTEPERVQLYWLHSILAELKPNEADDHRKAMSILRDGYHELLYDHEVLVAMDEPMTQSDAHFVYSVLDLFTYLQHSYQGLPLDQRAATDEADLRFDGFDGNNESRLMAFARFNIEQLGKWSSLKIRDFNSHMPMREIYERMLQAAPKIHPERGYSAEQIKAIRSARVHPDNREASISNLSQPRL
jgi:uncharacterized protein YfbU (UPF0304 family)